MLKKLKIKFVLINMCLAGIVLLLAVSTVCYNTYRQDKAEIDKALEMAVGDMPEDKAVPLEIGKPEAKVGAPEIQRKDFMDTSPFNYAAVVAHVTENEAGEREVSLLKNQNVSMSDKILKEAADAVLDGGVPEGRLTDFDLFYMKVSVGDSEKIAFVDSTYFDNVMRRNLITSLVLFVAGMIVLFFISLLLSRLAVAPVRKAWRQQQQFVADASHELKTPLTVILANNDILLSHESKSAEEQKKWIESTREEAVHMKNLVNDLLFLAQSDEDETNRRMLKGNVNISELVTGICLQLEPVIFEKGVSLETEIEQDINMEADITQIKQLTHILLDNAAKYAGDGGRINLKLCESAAKIKLTVANTGIPIASEELSHIFERFYRSDKARSREGGYGLGLAIARTIVENHGGKITAYSSRAKTSDPDGLSDDILTTCMTVVF